MERDDERYIDVAITEEWRQKKQADAEKKKTGRNGKSAYTSLIKPASGQEEHPYTSLVVEVYKGMLDHQYMNISSSKKDSYEATTREAVYARRIADLEIKTASATLERKPVTVSKVKNILEDLHQNTVNVIYENLRCHDGGEHQQEQLEPENIKTLFYNIKSNIGCTNDFQINTFVTGDEKLTWREQVFVMRIRELETSLNEMQNQIHEMRSRSEHGSGRTREMLTPSCINQDSAEDLAKNNHITDEIDQSGSSYVNTRETALSKFPWYVGACSSKEAIKMLYFRGGTHGLFLVRERIDSPGTYAIGINCKGSAVHIRIKENGNAYTIDAKTHFSSIPSLIIHYQKHMMDESFPDLTTTLNIPWNDFAGSSTEQETWL